MYMYNSTFWDIGSGKSKGQMIIRNKTYTTTMNRVMTSQSQKEDKDEDTQE